MTDSEAKQMSALLSGVVLNGASLCEINGTNVLDKRFNNRIVSGMMNRKSSCCIKRSLSFTKSHIQTIYVYSLHLFMHLLYFYWHTVYLVRGFVLKLFYRTQIMSSSHTPLCIKGRVCTLPHKQ